MGKKLDFEEQLGRVEKDIDIITTYPVVKVVFYGFKITKSYLIKT
ncbi:hypothetical protein FRUB_05323 [Fimbriiglobus ruber]|uniref:Uncharacterized protein n=1 Tax=Fimbriiglobus ruber TaxID=1908690 RepID=A0A225DL67_9BACT|nr:hypothetical protein FRUB_05323 [Fimbriiglobus ruber]